VVVVVVVRPRNRGSLARSPFFDLRLLWTPDHDAACYGAPHGSRPRCQALTLMAVDLPPRRQGCRCRDQPLDETRRPSAALAPARTTLGQFVVTGRHPQHRSLRLCMGHLLGVVSCRFGAPSPVFGICKVGAHQGFSAQVLSPWQGRQTGVSRNVERQVRSTLPSALRKVSHAILKASLTTILHQD
jgi:hypothetical protein